MSIENQRPTVLLTDVGGVLIRNYDGTATDVQTRLGLDDASFKRLRPSLIDQSGSGQIDEQTFWNQFAEHGAPLVSTAENIFGTRFEENFEQYDDVIQEMHTIGRSGIRLAILSNTIEPHASIHRIKGTYDIFEPHVFLSHEICLRKPGTEAYEYTLQNLGVPAQEVVFIDDRQDNLDAAKELGMQTIHAISPSQTIAALQHII